MSVRRSQSWQLILADLSLILFLVTLSALASEEAKEKGEGKAGENRPSDPAIAASHALFRPSAHGPSLRQWLTDQSPDPRATLTIFAVHSSADFGEMWQTAHELAKEAQDQEFAVRVVVTKGSQSEIYASLAYDEAQETSDLIEND